MDKQILCKKHKRIGNLARHRIPVAESSCHRRMHTVVILTWFLFLLLPTAADLRAQESAAKSAKRGLILVLSCPLDEEAEKIFQGIIARSVRWNLERKNLGVIEKSVSFYEAYGKPSPLALLDSSDKERADFVLLTEYANRGPDLEIRMSWYDLKTGEQTGEVTRLGRKDLMLDKMIRELLGELLAMVEESIALLPPRETAPETAPFESVDTGSESQSETSGFAARADRQPSPPSGGTTQPEEFPEVKRQRHFEIGLGCAPFIATGVASEYFKLGILPSLILNYLFQGERSCLALGIYAGVNYFHASGELASADIYLIPMGLSLRYEIGGERFPSAMLGLSSGPALLLMDSSSSGVLLGPTFYGRGSVGIRLPIGNTFGVTLEAGYDLYWEKPHPIMGFSPAVVATFRL